MQPIPLSTWISSITRELTDYAHSLPLTVQEVEWLENIWQHYYVSPAEAALLLTSVYKP